MYSVLDKDTIEMEIIPHIPPSQRGFPPTVPLVEIVNSILYKLKTGVQWHQLPVKALFESRSLSYREKIDLSSTDLDGSHTAIIDSDDYFNQKLYDQQFAIERTNAWVDS